MEKCLRNRLDPAPFLRVAWPREAKPTRSGAAVGTMEQNWPKACRGRPVSLQAEFKSGRQNGNSGLWSEAMRTGGLGSRRRRFGGLVIGAALALVLMNVPRRVADSQILLPIAGNHPASVPTDWRPLSGGQVLHLRAILSLRNTDQMAKLEADLQDRDSPLYHRWLTTDQFISRFGPTPQQMNAVAGWLDQPGIASDGERYPRTQRGVQR